MKLLALSTAVACALCVTAVASAHIIKPGCNNRLPAKQELACAKFNKQHALATVFWAKEVLKHLRVPSASTRATLRNIIANHQWLYHTMSARVAEAQRRLVAVSYPPHHALWTCLLPHEGGTWDDADRGHNGHYGGLQMHPDWGYGTSYYASDDSQLTQEWAAEKAYRASGYSRGFLSQQWGQTIGYCWAYA